MDGCGVQRKGLGPTDLDLEATNTQKQNEWMRSTKGGNRGEKERVLLQIELRPSPQIHMLKR